MDWTVTDYQHATHNPIVEVNGQPGTSTIVLDAGAGSPVVLDASMSRDPEGQKLPFH